ncbi:MAG: efflux RND transporter periplasmic adaptor subunit [Deltaproteobacteria bacterium]|nr:efflux RND transporter periplasmic adaptor subunit [Deltaproteobacteria bacterium]MBW2664932.1 efflux RND transporter periplasmic adaptor subunit [Deltaproteobacteria bacterium]
MMGQARVSRMAAVDCWSSLILTLFIGALGLACDSGSRDEPEALPPPEHSQAGNTDEQQDELVSFTAAEIEEFELRVAPAGKAIIERFIELPGVVRANEDRLAHIVPRFAGIVTKVRRRIGDTVKSGETLAVIESSQSLSPYALKTLLDGVIIEKHVTRGEAVTPESQAFVVADLKTVWIDLSVYQRDLTRILPGQPARVIAGHDLPDAKGVVSYVTPVVDEVTRTAIARIVLDNPDGFWRPGMFATAEVTVERVEIEIAVPITALHSLGQETVVFVKDSTGFRPRPVTVGRRDAQWAEVREGLAAGEPIVVHGGFTVKSELLRGEFSGGHGH